MPRKNLPSYVQRVGPKGGPFRYRGWWSIAGKRRFGPLRDTAALAHEDALVARASGILQVTGTLGDRADEWLAGLAVSRTADTLDFYRSRLARIYRTIPKTVRLDRLRPAFFRQMIQDAQQAGLSARTIQHMRSTMRALLSWARRRGYVQGDPLAGVDWPRPVDTQPHVFGELELANVVARITDPLASSLSILIAYTGLRRAEVARLQIRDLDFAQGVLWVRGKSMAQSHPMVQEAADAARTLCDLATGQYVVNGRTDEARREHIAEAFRKWQRLLKEPRLHPHALRHSCGTIMLRNGVSPATVQRFLRHSSYAMTQRYVHMVEQDLRGGIGTMRLVRRDEGQADHA